MALTDKEILQQFASALVPQIKKVSKRFAPSVESEVTDKTMVISASPYIMTLVDGRAPTSSGAKRGNPTLQQIIRAWIDTKSISPRPNANGKTPTLEQLSWAISKSIHLNGDLLYQRVKAGGQKNNIFEAIITKSRIDALLNQFSEKYYNEVNTINLPQL